MSRTVALLLILLAQAATGAVVRSNFTTPITEVVSIDSVEVFSQSSGHQGLNECAGFARTQVENEATPVIKVCGSGTRVTVFLRNRCEPYSKYSESIGLCDTTTTGCDERDPATHPWLHTAQSYRIEAC